MALGCFTSLRKVKNLLVTGENILVPMVNNIKHPTET